MTKLINVGFGNLVSSDKIIAVVKPDAAPVKRMVANAKKEERIIDATQGRRTKSVIVTTENKLVLSALQCDTICKRFGGTNETISNDEREEKNE